MSDRTVLSIVGPGRSGTTVLANLLGEVSGVFSAGELRWLWSRGIQQGWACGCGESPMRCPLWSRIISCCVTSARDGGSSDLTRDAEQVLRLQAEIAPLAKRLAVIRTAREPEPAWGAIEHLRDHTARLCDSIFDVTGAQVVVDSSKRAQEAAILAALPGIQHRVLHVVRDPRAVAYSWSRAKPLGGPGGGVMAQRRAWGSVGRWTENCLGAEVLRRQLPAAHWFFLRYEDFARQPRESVGRILSWLGGEGQNPVEIDGWVTFGPNHTIAGNPDRFRLGRVLIRPDSSWRSDMKLRDRLVVGAVAAPLMFRYGYLRDHEDGKPV